MRLGIVGSGKIVKDFLTITNVLPNLSLAAIATTKRSKAVGQELAQQYGIQRAYDDYRKLLQDDGVDTVYVAVPNSLHFEIALAAIQAKKNVICEKPLVYTVREAQKLHQAAKQAGVILLEAITNIHLPNFVHLKQDLPKLGPIHIVNLNYTQYSSRYPALLAGEMLPVFDPAKGGGALMDLGIYPIHLAGALFGEPNKVTHFANHQFGTDTSGITLLEYDDKLVSLIAAKDSYAKCESVIEGEAGSLVIQGAINTLPQYRLDLRDQSSTSYNYNEYDHRMVNEFLDFIQIIDQKQVAEAERLFSESLTALKILEAAREKL